MTRVVVVCPWFYRGDAVGAAARDTFLQLQASSDLEVRALWTVNDYDDVRGRRVDGLADMLLEPIFLEADILIYVFAVHHPLFDALLIGNGRARQIVRFHNVTPRALMPEKHWPVIERSFVQMQTFRHANEIWADSRENFEELERRGLAQRARIEPLAVEFPVRIGLGAKTGSVLTLLYVGRFFRSKGVLDLIDVARILRERLGMPFCLRLIGNERFSDPDYLSEVRHAIAVHGLDGVVEFVGSVPQDVLADAYRGAHILITGSRHEGFCVPVIEGLASGCVPVSYAISNLRYIADGLGRLAKSADAEGLADAVCAVARGGYATLPSIGPTICVDRGDLNPSQFDEAVSTYLADFTPACFGTRIQTRVRHLASIEAREGSA